MRVGLLVPDGCPFGHLISSLPLLVAFRVFYGLVSLLLWILCVVGLGSVFFGKGTLFKELWFFLPVLRNLGRVLHHCTCSSLLGLRVAMTLK